MADTDSPDRPHLATLRYVDNRKAARGRQLAQVVRRNLSAAKSASLRRLVLTAARVELIRKVAKRITRHRWAKRGLHVLEALAQPGAVPTPEIFREVIAGTEKAPDSIRGRVVLVCGNLSPGGAERQVVNTLLGLDQYELESLRLLCDFLTPNHPDKYDFYLPRLREAGIEAREIIVRKTRWISRQSSIPKALARNASFLPPRLVHDISTLYWEFRKLRPEVVHVWLDWSNIRAGIAAVMAGVPRIILSCRNLNPSHFDLYQNYMDPAYEALAELPNVVLLNNSHAGAIDYARWLKLPESRFRVIYNGLHCGSHSRASEEEIAAFREGLGVPPGALVVGSAYRFHPEKRPLLWIESAAAIAAKHPNVRFVVFGQGPMRDDMLERARELGIADSITFPGITDEIDLALSSMDVLLLTSSGEGTPNVALEAQSVGTPVVANDAGGMKEAVESGVTGWIVEEPDPQAIAERVVWVLSDPTARTSARQAGPAFVSRRFGLRRMVSETLLAYNVDPETVSPQPLATPSEDRLADELAQHLKRLPGTSTYTKLLELKQFSMLHWEVLAILQFFAKHLRGAILEIGPYLGAGTIALAQTAGKKHGPIITVEVGGAHEAHPSIPTKDILGDLRRNLQRYGVSGRVHLLEGNCADTEIIGKIGRCLGQDRIGLMVIDADGEVERDMLNFARFCDPSCYLVIDDYVSEGAKEKATKIKPYMDRMVAEGKMRQFGIYGWGTWVGQLVDDRF